MTYTYFMWGGEGSKCVLELWLDLQYSERWGACLLFVDDMISMAASQEKLLEFECNLEKGLHERKYGNDEQQGETH